MPLPAPRRATMRPAPAILVGALAGTLALGTAWTGPARAAGVCFQPINSIEFSAIRSAADALKAKGCGPGDVFVTVVPRRIRAGLSLVAASFCDYRTSVTMHDAGDDTSELSCVLGEARQPKTSGK